MIKAASYGNLSISSIFLIVFLTSLRQTISSKFLISKIISLATSLYCQLPSIRRCFVLIYFLILKFKKRPALNTFSLIHWILSITLFHIVYNYESVHKYQFQRVCFFLLGLMNFFILRNSIILKKYSK